MHSVDRATKILAAERYGGSASPAWRQVRWAEHVQTRSIGGLRLHFVDIGVGEPVLLLHGHGSTWQYWLEVMALLRGQRRVIAVDLPGFGLSQAHPFRTASMGTLVAAITDLLKQLQVSRCDVIGHSFGTILGIELAVSEPALVATLTLAGGPASSIVDLFAHPLRTAWRQPRLATTVVGDMLTAGMPIPTWIRRVVARSNVLRRLAFSPYVTKPERLDADLAELLMAGVGAPAYFHLPLKSRGFIRAPVEAIRCPVLLVNGDHDAFVPPGDITAFLRRVCTAQAFTIEGAGHLVTVEFPRTFINLFTEFVGTVSNGICHA